MANDKKMVEAITSMDVDFAQWYTDVVKKAELCDYASVKGCMVIRAWRSWRLCSLRAAPSPSVCCWRPLRRALARLRS